MKMYINTEYNKFILKYYKDGRLKQNIFKNINIKRILFYDNHLESSIN